MDIEDTKTTSPHSKKKDDNNQDGTKIFKNSIYKNNAKEGEPKRNKKRRSIRTRPNKLADKLNDDITSTSPIHVIKETKDERLHDKLPYQNQVGQNSIQQYNNTSESKSAEQALEKLSLESNDDISNYNFTWKIEPVNNPSKFWFFRKRNTNYPYVRLGSFSHCILLTILNINQYKRQDDLVSKEQRYQKAIADLNLLKNIKSNVITTLSHNESWCSNNCQAARIEMDKNDGKNKKSDKSIAKNQDKETKQDTEDKNKKTRIKDSPAKHRKRKLYFPDYITLVEVKKGLGNGSLVKGLIRINQRNPSDSFVNNNDNSRPDYYIPSVINRNRALDGDEVVLKCRDKSDRLCKAVVVYILAKIHSRTAVGFIKLNEKYKDIAILEPRDKRLPSIHIPSTNWPDGFSLTPGSYEDVLYCGKILEWENPDHAVGTITEIIGRVGDIKVEVTSILKEFALDPSPFSSDILNDLPQLTEIPPEEYTYREDIRKYCIFTIDPLTARDLDDAVSAIKLKNGHYEIGIHISDASFYLPENSRLDQIVKKKATTIYLVDNVYHMLPVELCLHCSLLPGKDKLGFSVFLEIDLEGHIYTTRFARTILNSCTQLAYEHAQQMIDHPDRDFNIDELPPIYNGFAPNDLRDTVHILHKISLKLKEARIRNGALKIDQVKLLFSVDDESREPTDFIAYEHKESHRLIEEFMLLANISAAKQIYTSFPDIAFLRCHEKPKPSMLYETQLLLEACGMHVVNISSSKNIGKFLEENITDDFEGICRGILLNKMFSKTMKLAKYFCASTKQESDFKHYALSIPIYTHFTSPIRRYPDIMVHRLLAASLGYTDKPNWQADEVQAIANNCNQQKLSAKRASEACSEFYLSYFVMKHQPFIEKCVVIDIKNKSFDAVVIRTGSVVRITPSQCEGNPIWNCESNSDTPRKTLPRGRIPSIYLTFPAVSSVSNAKYDTLEIKLFSVVNVSLSAVKDSYKLEGYLLKSSLLI